MSVPIGGHQHGVSIESSINLGEKLFRITRDHGSDLYLGEVVYVSIIFYIPASWVHFLNGYDFYFWWRDTENRPLFLKLSEY